jgi:predicted nucleic acid-binding protein
MILLDSNTIIYLSKKLISIDDVFFDDSEVYAVSVITYMEVLGFAFTSNKEKEFIEKLFSCLQVIYIDKAIVDEVLLIKQSNHVKLPDAIICATAIVNKAILVTNDIRVKSIENLKIHIIGLV